LKWSEEVIYLFLLHFTKVSALMFFILPSSLLYFPYSLSFSVEGKGILIFISMIFLFPHLSFPIIYSSFLYFHPLFFMVKASLNFPSIYLPEARIEESQFVDGLDKCLKNTLKPMSGAY
jgi:hypothetical protein